MKNGPGKIAQEIFSTALKAVDPNNAVSGEADTIRSLFEKGQYSRLLVVGFGKAACPMAKAVEDSIGNLPYTGAVITKYGHCAPHFAPRNIAVFEGAHPVPDAKGMEGTSRIIELLMQADEKTFVLCLVSGGGSALLVSPYDGITLEEKQKTTHLLLKAGADVYELNTVRKHISMVKGGRLSGLAYPSGVLSLILSDVMGDALDVISSGPTAPDTSTYADALHVLIKYALIDKVPASVREIIERGIKGDIAETPKAGTPVFDRVENIIIGSNIIALQAAKIKAEELGFRSEIVSSAVKGEAREAGRWLAKEALKNKQSKTRSSPLCLISGGETTVTVKGPGLGGRNMEFALGFADEIKGTEGITLLSAGTDGTDGPTDATGAIVDGRTISLAEAKGLNLKEYLGYSDSYHYLQKIDSLLITGPTGTNVMDVQIVIIE
jgi:glycerate-2-kinase